MGSMRNGPHLLAVALLAGSVLPASAGVTVSYLHQLSDFSGTVRCNDVRLHVDPRHDEVFIVDTGRIRVFDGSGMEIYSFEPDGSLGGVYDIATDEDGDILTLGYGAAGGGAARPFVARLDYRGEPKGRIEISGLPEELRGFVPNAMLYRNGALILASRQSLMVVEFDREGRFQRSVDLARLLDLDEAARADAEIGGIAVDDSGNLLFTVPTLFRAFVLSPKGTLRSFGKVGSAPGNFGVVGGIASDRFGNLYVADRLRSVVVVFDKDFRFLAEFGGYGDRPESLVRPGSLQFDSKDRLYVTQMRGRGVAVFASKSDDPGPSAVSAGSERPIEDVRVASSGVGDRLVDGVDRKPETPPTRANPSQGGGAKPTGPGGARTAGLPEMES